MPEATTLILDLDLHGGVPIYRQLMDQVRRQILLGQLQEGEQIESVKSLASRLKINPMTVSKAYGYLVQEGFLDRRKGVGLFVRAVRKDVKRRRQTQMLDQAMSNVAALAVQMGIPEKEALQLFSELYRKFDHQTMGEQR
ncbi:MAG: GntR family transcriptional regulator [Planctomycetota bacterium]|nr:MAG: GntR family transcriptional regulator [Planctomycetota bacterium]